MRRVLLRGWRDARSHGLPDPGVCDIIETILARDERIGPVRREKWIMMKKWMASALIACLLVSASLGLAYAAEEGLAMPALTAFFGMEEEQMRWENGILIFHLEGDATDVLCEYAELLPEEPYGYEMKGEPNTLRLGDSTSVDYAFRNPVQENKSILFAWAYFEQVDITRVVLSCATENIVWQDCDSTASRSVKALDFDEGEALRDQATGNGSGNTGASSSGSSFSNQCISCSGTGRCSACGGDGRVYKILAGTTERVEQNCTSCNGTGRCWNCGGDGKK